jgi:hypothetical protein
MAFFMSDVPIFPAACPRSFGVFKICTFKIERVKCVKIFQVNIKYASSKNRRGKIPVYKFFPKDNTSSETKRLFRKDAFVLLTLFKPCIPYNLGSQPG